MAIEIVSFPINSMVIFHSYVNVYQRVNGEIYHEPLFFSLNCSDKASDPQTHHSQGTGSSATFHRLAGINNVWL